MVSGHQFVLCIIQVTPDLIPPVPDGFMQHRQVGTFEPNPNRRFTLVSGSNVEIKSSGQEQKKVPMLKNDPVEARQVAVIANREGFELWRNDPSPAPPRCRDPRMARPMPTAVSGTS